jgi:hypothetical protein
MSKAHKGFLFSGGNMCYIEKLSNKGLEFSLSDCVGGISFDWEDKDFQLAVKNRDARIFEILDWATTGGAELYDTAQNFSALNTDSRSMASNYDRLSKCDYKEIENIKENPYLDSNSLKIINSFLDGTLEIVAKDEREDALQRKKKKVSFGFVYLIELENGLFKIGKAKEVSARMKVFTVSFPMKWTIAHYFSSQDYSIAEDTLHKKFCDKREIGEFFRLTPADVAYIKSIGDGQL